MSSAPCRKRCTLHSSFCCNDSLRWILCLASQPRTTETRGVENRDIRCVKLILKEHLCCWIAIMNITFLAGDDLFMKLVTAVVELVCLPVPQKHFAAAHLHKQCNMYYYWFDAYAKSHTTLASSSASGRSQQSLWHCFLLEISQVCDLLLESWKINDVWVWSMGRAWACSLTLHSLPELRVHLGGDRGHFIIGAQNCTGVTYVNRDYSFLHMLIVWVPWVCKQGPMKRCLHGIVKECVCVREAGAHVTCRVTNADTTAV